MLATMRPTPTTPIFSGMKSGGKGGGVLTGRVFYSRRNVARKPPGREVFRRWKELRCIARDAAILLVVKIPALLFAALALPFAPASAAEATAAPTAPAMREISPGVYQIGAVRIDQAQRTATFPGKVNMADGNLEYLIVTTEGATHESLLSTGVQPSDLHFSMLLLGAKGAGLEAPAPEDAPPPQINRQYLEHAPRLKGDRISIRVKWSAGGMEKSVPVEDWILNTETKKPAARGPWLYTGSMFRNGQFLAQLDGAHAALVTYPAALINNPRKGSDNDLAWEVNTRAVPPVDTPVEIVIQLEGGADQKTETKK